MPPIVVVGSRQWIRDHIADPDLDPAQRAVQVHRIVTMFVESGAVFVDTSDLDLRGFGDIRSALEAQLNGALPDPWAAEEFSDLPHWPVAGVDELETELGIIWSETGEPVPERPFGIEVQSEPAEPTHLEVFANWAYGLPQDEFYRLIDMTRQENQDQTPLPDAAVEPSAEAYTGEGGEHDRPDPSRA
jgi:hypothetical protein